MKAPSKTTLDAFDRFWAAYPYRAENPKAPARVVFARLLKEGVCAEALIAAAGRYASFISREKVKSIFIPHARKWLNQRYFEDYMTDPDAPASAPEGPSPDHPLACLFAEVGEGPWLSYFAPLVIDQTLRPVRITAPHRFALERLTRDYGPRIVAVLGPVKWEVR